MADVLDPFSDSETEYKTTEIRYSRSRKAKTPFKTSDSASNRAKRSHLWLLAAIAALVLVAVLAIIFVPKWLRSNSSEDATPLVNPTGREASSEYTDNTSDSELRAAEQDKLNSVMSLIAREDWEHANAFFKTIFPAYLDSCGKYDYYRTALSLAKNFSNFSISEETALTRSEELALECRR